MAKPRFTPGPWRWEPEGIFADKGRKEYLVAEVDGDGVLPAEEYDANARLIVAAPEMYEALRKALPLLENEREVLIRSYSNPDSKEILDPDALADIAVINRAIHAIETALAKAEGQ